MINNELHRETRDGREVTAYGFACGYDQRVGSDNSVPRATLLKEGCYHLRGFDANGNHFWDSFDYLADARRAFAKFSTAYRKSLA
jgi:hypothetical protein